MCIEGDNISEMEDVKDDLDRGRIVVETGVDGLPLLTS